MRSAFKNILLAGSLALAVWASPGHAADATIGISIPAATHGWTGGLVYHTKQTVEKMKAAFPNLDFIVVTSPSSSQQVNDIEDLMSRKVDALVVLPMESDPLTEPVKAAKAKGVFIAVVDRGLSEPNIEDLYVGGDNPQYGIAAAEYFKKKFPDGGKIVVMRGIATAIDNIRIEAFNKALEGSKIEVLDMQYANWNPDKGFEVMQDYLQRFPQIDGVWAGDDDAALGAMEAIKQSERKGISVLGGSGMNKVIALVKDGHDMVDADIFYPPTLIIPAIQLVAMKFATKAPINGRYVLGSPLITKDNAAEYYFPDAPY